MAINNFCNNNCRGVNKRSGCGCNGVGNPCRRDSVGLTGHQGPQGLRGATGATGAQGMAATVSVESSASVPFDDAPSVVNVGTPQDAVLRFSIPAGKPGAVGAQGPKGDTGPAGPKGSTGPAGVKAYGQLVSIISSADLINGVPTQIPLPYGGESENVSLVANKMTIQESGCYVVYYNMFPGLILTAGYADLTLHIRVNGVAIPYTARTLRSTSGTHFLAFYGSTLAWLKKGDVIDATFTCNDDGRFFFSVDNISSIFLNKID